MKIMMLRMESHKAMISINASRTFFIEKKNTLHRIFKIKLMPYRTATFTLFLGPVNCQAKASDIPIRKNRMLHAIGNAQFGGVMLGFTDSYHVPVVFCDVKILPTKATR
jgi:hypothetical protein